MIEGATKARGGPCGDDDDGNDDAKDGGRGGPEDDVGARGAPDGLTVGTEGLGALGAACKDGGVDGEPVPAADESARGSAVDAEAGGQGVGVTVDEASAEVGRDVAAGRVADASETTGVEASALSAATGADGEAIIAWLTGAWIRAATFDTSLMDSGWSGGSVTAQNTAINMSHSIHNRTAGSTAHAKLALEH